MESNELEGKAIAKSTGSHPLPSLGPYHIAYRHTIFTMSETIFHGPVTRTRRKNSLVGIAEALQVPDLPATANKDVHIAKIKKFISQNPEMIANDPRFQQLVAYRPGSMGTGRDASKAGGKTSADKAAEDELQSDKDGNKPTGCALC